MSSDSQNDRIEPGVATKLRKSPLDIVVVRGAGRDVLVKADEQVLLLDESEARILRDEIDEKLQEEA